MAEETGGRPAPGRPTTNTSSRSVLPPADTADPAGHGEWLARRAASEALRAQLAACRAAGLRLRHERRLRLAADRARREADHA